MSYIIAFVKFTDSGAAYPVECFRNDLTVGEQVLVQYPKRPLAVATVLDLAFLNWNCSGRIRCKLTEAERALDGHWNPQRPHVVVGLVSGDALASGLSDLGWVKLKPRQIYRFAMTYSNAESSANVLIRKNGVDLQILPLREVHPVIPFRTVQENPREGRFVSHYLAQTTFNLYEGILRFADSFMADCDNFDRFFKSVGSSDRRTEELKQQSASRKANSNESDSYTYGDYHRDCSDGSGSAVYAGDGVSIGSGGRIFDDGR